eukprot:PhF_6_TR10840/c1_g1_i3/m.17511
MLSACITLRSKGLMHTFTWNLCQWVVCQTSSAALRGYTKTLHGSTSPMLWRRWPIYTSTTSYTVTSSPPICSSPTTAQSNSQILAHVAAYQQTQPKESWALCHTCRQPR